MDRHASEAFDDDGNGPSRRSFLRSAAVGAGVVAATGLDAFPARRALAATGPIAPHGTTLEQIYFHEGNRSWICSTTEEKLRKALNSDRNLRGTGKETTGIIIGKNLPTFKHQTQFACGVQTDCKLVATSPTISDCFVVFLQSQHIRLHGDYALNDFGP